MSNALRWPRTALSGATRTGRRPMASPPAAGPPLRARRRLAIALGAGDTFASIVAS
jgi:hypothetical protein